MSSLICELWIPNPVTPEQVQTLDALIHQIGVNVTSNEQHWKDMPGSAQAAGEARFPIDLVIGKASSDALKHHLMNRRDFLDAHPVLQLDRSWSFEFASTVPFPDAPHADKYAREGVYPFFGMVLTHDVWRLMTGWGTSEYSSELGVRDRYSELEAVFASLNALPVATVSLISRFPFDSLLMGYLALWIMDYLGGLLVIRSRTTDIPKTLDELLERNRRGDFPGKIDRFTDTYQTPSKTLTLVWHVVDADFLREWIKHPDFGLY